MKQVFILTSIAVITVCCSFDRSSNKLPQPKKSNQEMDSLIPISKDSILSVLDNALKSPYSEFINFDHVYCEYANGRLSLFRSNDKWALVFEKLGFNFRDGEPVLFEIYYFGNCLENLPVENGYVSNIMFFGIENDIYSSIEAKKDSIKFNGYLVKIPLNKEAYTSLKIPLEIGTNKIYEGAVLRYLVEKNKEVTYASDDLLLKCLPKDLKKIMVIDEWYHENYQQFDRKSKPSTQPFYQNVAEILATGDIKLYKKPKKTNTNWGKWLESGTY